MRQTILALTAALAVLPALSFASAPPDTLPLSFPVVRWQALDSSELAQLGKMGRSVRAGGQQDYCQRAWAGKCNSPALSILLPDASFYNRSERDVRSTTPANYHAVAILRGRVYDLAAMNMLLADLGYTFEAPEVRDAAIVAVLWTLMEKQAQAHCPLRPGALPGTRDTIVLTTAIPAVTFKSIERTARPVATDPNTPYAVYCTIGQRPVVYRVEFGRDYVASLHEGLEGTRPLVTFLPPGLFRSRGAPPAPQK